MLKLKMLLPLNIQFFAEITSPELVGVKQSVTDEFLLLNPMQTPLLNLLGFSSPVTATNHEWFEDEMYGTKSIVVEAALADATSIKVADAEPFRTDQIVKVNDEFIKVTAVDFVANTLTVVRGYGETLAADIAVDTEIEVQFVEGAEGNDAREARYKPRIPVNNYTQIFDETISITGTAEAVAQHGVADEYEKEKAKKIIELGLQLEKALINGKKFRNGLVSQMNGMRSFITSNVSNANLEELNEIMIADQLQNIFTAGGFKSGGSYNVMVPAKQKRVISKFSHGAVRIDNGDNTRGQNVTRLVTDFGEFDVMLNDNLSSDEIIIFDASRAMIRPLRGREFSHTYLGVKGDYTEGMIVGEYTFEFHQEKAHARIYNLK